MFNLLETMSLQIGSVGIDDSIQVAEAVNRRLQDLLNAEVIRIYWRQDSDDGVILFPVTFYNKTDTQDPRSFSLTTEANGILSWTFENKETIWIENIKSTNLETGITNEHTGEIIDPKYLSYFRYGPDSMVVIPYIIDGNIHGVFSAEINRSGVFNKRIIDLLRTSAKYIGPILNSAYQTSSKMEKKKKAVKNFMDHIRDFSFDRKLLSDVPRTCFIARPFNDEFHRVEHAISEGLSKYKIKANCYEPRAENRLVFSDIKRQIETSHFCIADVTGNQPNVMSEVGMMMMIPAKKFYLFKNKNDKTPWPFDIQQYHMHHYDIDNRDGGTMKIVGGGGGELRPLDEIFEIIVSELEKDKEFLEASEWFPNQ